MADQRIETLKTCYTSVIHDVLRGMGLRNFTLPPEITPLQPEMTLCGPVFTIEGRMAFGKGTRTGRPTLSTGPPVRQIPKHVQLYETT